MTTSDEIILKGRNVRYADTVYVRAPPLKLHSLAAM